MTPTSEHYPYGDRPSEEGFDLTSPVEERRSPVRPRRALPGVPELPSIPDPRVRPSNPESIVPPLEGAGEQQQERLEMAPLPAVRLPGIGEVEDSR